MIFICSFHNFPVEAGMNTMLQNEKEIPKFMVRLPQFQAEKVTTGDRMFIAGHNYYYNDGRLYMDYPMPEYWVTDRLNNIYLFSIDEGEFWLVINNQPARIVAKYEYSGNKKDGYRVEWNVEKAISPKGLSYLSISQFRNIIQKALEAYSYVLLAQYE